MFSRSSQKGWKLAGCVLILPIVLILLSPSIFYTFSFLRQSLAFKSEASMLIQIKEAFEKKGFDVRIAIGQASKWFDIPVRGLSNSGTAYFAGSKREKYLAGIQGQISYVPRNIPGAEIEETIIRGDDWIIYGHTIIAPDKGTKDEAELLRSILEETRFNRNRFNWSPIHESKMLWFTNWVLWSGPIDNPWGRLFQLMAQPGKWFCYLLVPILGFTPYYLLFIWPLLFVGAVAVYIKRRLKRIQPTTDC